MAFDIVSGGAEKDRIVAQTREAVVATTAKEFTNCAGFVTVIDVWACVLRLFAKRRAANRACPALSVEHCGIGILGKPVDISDAPEFPCLGQVHLGASRLMNTSDRVSANLAKTGRMRVQRVATPICRALHENLMRPYAEQR